MTAFIRYPFVYSLPFWDFLPFGRLFASDLSLSHDYGPPTHPKVCFAFFPCHFYSKTLCSTAVFRIRTKSDPRKGVLKLWVGVIKRVFIIIDNNAIFFFGYNNTKCARNKCVCIINRVVFVIILLVVYQCFSNCTIS